MDRNSATGRFVASATSRPVAAVADRLCLERMDLYAVQNCTMSSFFLSCAMSVIFITLNSFVHMPESVRRIFISFTRFPCSLFAMCRHARLAP